MRRAETQRTLVREREAQIRSKGRKRNALRGTAECRLWAVMLLMLFLCASQSTSSYAGFSPGPLPYGTIPSPVACCLPGPPAASLIYWFSASRRAINHGIRGRRWLDCSAQRDREKRKEATDGLEKEKEEEGEGGPRSLCVQQTGYWWCLFLPGLYLCRGHVLLGVTWRGYWFRDTWTMLELPRHCNIYAGAAALLPLAKSIISAPAPEMNRRRMGKQSGSEMSPWEENMQINVVGYFITIKTSFLQMCGL